MRRLVLGWLAIAACVADPYDPEEAEPVAAPTTPEAEVPKPATPEIDEPAAAPVPTLPVTALPLTLLATQVPADPQQARATIRDGDAGTIASYRPGDTIRADAIIGSIADGKVTLVHDEREELLAVGVEPAQLEPDDVFYADLVDTSLSDAMTDGVQLDAGPGWQIKRPHNAWGTPRTVHRLREALRAYVRVADGGPDVHVGDISRSGGGAFPPHLSHRDGRDVDIGYVLLGDQADQPRFVHTHAHNIDRARTWTLLRILLESHAIAYVFMDYDVQELLYEHALGEGVPRDKLDAWFQYPGGNRAARGIIRDWRGHDDHFHVRFQP